MTELALKSHDFQSRALSPLVEMGAYEALWLRDRASFKTIADMFRDHHGAIPSDFVPREMALERAESVFEAMEKANIKDFGIRVHGAGEYPVKLRDARHPIELLYYRGWWDLVETDCVAIVGTRKPSPEGAKRTAQLAQRLAKDGYTVVSGLARGIDTVAHEAAIGVGGKTIAVLGTPLNHCYPPENADLQRELGDTYLLISQVPVLRYAQAKHPSRNSFFFPERNVTMSALTKATIIVEAGETSGTLHQARAALAQGRKLFILDSCFEKDELTWPRRFAEQGAIRVREYDDIRANL